MSRKRAKLTGKGRCASFLALPHHVLRSEAYRTLSHPARAALVDVGSLFRGNNNGDLAALAPAIMEPLGWRSRSTLTRAIGELVEHGLLELTRQGGRNMPSLYALSWLGIDECGGKLDVSPSKAPSNKWRSFSVLPCPLEGQPLSVRRTSQA